jgi:hypothetical protein
MKSMKLTEDLQRKIQDFMMYTQSNLDSKKELDNFLNMLSPSLKKMVMETIFLNAIQKNRIMNGNLEIIDYVVHNIEPVLYKPEDFIVR